MDRRWLIPLVLIASLGGWYALEPPRPEAEPQPATPAVDEFPAVEPTVSDVRFAGASSPLRMDIYASDLAGPRPVVVMLNNRWRRRVWGTPSYRPAWLTDAGFVYVALTPRAGDGPTAAGGGGDAPSDDVEALAQALAWVSQNIARQGGDPGRLVLVGDGTGARDAALVGLDPRRLQAVGLEPADLRGVVLLDGTTYDIPAVVEGPESRFRERYIQRFGADPATQREASPVMYVGGEGGRPPFLILHTSMRSLAAEQSRLLADALLAAGRDAELVTVERLSRMSLSRDLGLPGDEATVLLERFLHRVVAEPQAAE